MFPSVVQNSPVDICTIRPQSPKSPLILVVDDDDDSLTLMAYILDQLSFRACFVADGLAALRAAQQQPQLILSDIHLPEMDGYSLIRQLRADGATQNIPVVAVTALASADDRHKILNAGFDGYLSKPFLIQSLEQLIHRFIAVPSITP